VQENISNEIINIDFKAGVGARDLPLHEARKILMFKGPFADEFMITGKRDFGHFVVKLEYLWISFTFLLQNGTFKYYVIYIMISALGFLVSPIFYSFHLLDVIVSTF
jgi:hypothetical protein